MTGRPPRAADREPRLAEPPTDESAPQLLTREATVLIGLLTDPEVTVSALSERLGVTARTVRRGITELQAAGILNRRREGNRNHYEFDYKASVSVGVARVEVARLLQALHQLGLG